MKIHAATIRVMTEMNGEGCVLIDGSPILSARPGQYLQAFGVGSHALMPTLLYPCGADGDGLLFCGSYPADWQPGSELHLRGPRGNGFHLPPLSRRVVLSTLDQIPLNRLLGVAASALQQGAEVTVVANSNLPDLDHRIEILPLEELNEGLRWADYAVCALAPAEPGQLRRMMGDDVDESKIEVMLETAMMCDESATCGVCAVSTRRGVALACKDGPVFRLSELEEHA